VFSGSQPRRGKSQSPVTRVAGWRETETLKPTDQAIERMVSESPGRNGSERTGGLENDSSGGRASRLRGEGSMERRIWLRRRPTPAG
jgi:hypothetical protein